MIMRFRVPVLCLAALPGLACLPAGALADWADNFDAYALGSIYNQGGWTGWAGVPSVAGTVSNLVSLSPAQSQEISYAQDSVHTYAGYTSGVCWYMAYAWIPSGFVGGYGGTYFTLMNTYTNGGSDTLWSVEFSFDSQDARIHSFCGSFAEVTLPYVTDQWSEIAVRIDLGNDWTQVYYNGTLLDDPALPDNAVLGGGYQWTKGVFGTDPYGLRNVAAVDLYANNSSPVYYDDMSLVGSGGGTAGACCLWAGGPCIVVASEEECSYMGTWQGPGTDCDPDPCAPMDFGACCHPDGSCSMEWIGQCSGDWLGPGTSCTPNPCPQASACCLPSDACVLLTQTACAAQSGFYLGDGATCGACASEGDLDNGETAILNPGGGSGDPTVDALVTITNVSGPNNASISVGETPTTPHPGAGGFQALGDTLMISTTLANGAFFMTVQIPFAQADLPPSTNPLSIDLTYFDSTSGNWVLAVDANTQNSPSHPGPRGDRYPVSGGTPPQLSPELGDYGVFWNPTPQVGFVWANVDHATDFAPGVPPFQPGDLNCDGVVNNFDITPFVLALTATPPNYPQYYAQFPTCDRDLGDINGDGRVDNFDITPFVALLTGG